MMWCPVSGCGTDSLAPSARTKHSATLVGGYVYLIGGRNGNLPLKDMWKYDLVDGRWSQLQPCGENPPCLQEHTAVAYKDGLYVFGGEVGFSAAAETPLWYYDIKRNTWRKVKTQKGVTVPRGRRGHTALIHRNAMLIYGGYQDLRGSSSELWSFHFETESWHLLSSKKTPNGRINANNDSIPLGRHKHSAVMHDDSMWIYGGMTDLNERNDLWKWCTVSKQWYQYKSKHNPGPLHSHAICKLPGSMLIFGGESNGQPTNDLWKFNFALENWEKVQIDGLKPQPRAESKAFAVSEFLLKVGTTPNDSTDITKVVKPVMRARSRTSSSVDRTARHSSYLPQNRITPSEKTYVFQPTTNNYIDGSDESFHKSLISNSNTTYKSAQPGSFLREIQKLSQLNLSKLSHNKCSYSVLNSANTESTESLLRQHGAGVNEENVSVTPVRNMMVKSQSAHFTNKKRLSCQISPEQMKDTNFSTTKNSQRSCKAPTTSEDNQIQKRKYEMKREPISVPNFSTIILPTPVLTPVEAAKLVYLDSEDDDDLQDPCINSIEVKQNTKDNTFYDTFKPASRDESYSSHLCASIYQNIPKSASVKFQCPGLEEVSDESVSTSDYASVERVNNHHKANGSKPDEMKKGILKTPTPASEGPFGFSNPHYMGPDIQEFLTNGNNSRHSWNVSDSKAQQYAKLLNTPDSGVGDMSGKSNSRHMFLMDELEMQHLDTRVNNEGKTQIDNSTKRIPPNTLTLINDGVQKRADKTRASSASRVERGRIENRTIPVQIQNETKDVTITSDANVQLHVFVIGGKEQGQITVFKRPISIWRLKLY